MNEQNIKSQSYDQLKIIIESINGYNDEVAIRGLKDRIEMTERMIKRLRE